MITAKLVLGTVLLLAGCRTPYADDASAVKINGNDVGGLKGYAVVNHMLNERLIDRPANVDTFQLGTYLGQGNGVGGVLPLLGAYGGEVANATFQNGAPNALNTLLWYVAFGRFADDASGVCATPPKLSATLKLTEDAMKLLQSLCAWPKTSAQERLEDLWVTVMGFQAPFEEFTAWQQAVTAPGSALSTQTGAKAVRALLLTLLMNPYFLLET